MRKIIYFLMMLLGLAGLAALYLFPVYNVNVEMTKDNSEYALAILDLPLFEESTKYSNYSQAKKEEKETFKKEYSDTLKLLHAIVAEDIELLYELDKYMYVNVIYQEQIGSAGHLNENSTPEVVESVIQTLVDKMGESAYEARRVELVKENIETSKVSLANKYKDLCAEGATDEEILAALDAKLVFTTEYLVMNNVFLQYRESQCDEEYVIIDINSINEEGFKIIRLGTSWKNMWNIDSNVWKKSEYNSLGFIDKVRQVTHDEDFINPLPLLLFSVVFLILVFTSLKFFFAGLKGMAGKKYPHTFVSSVIATAICFALILGVAFIPADYFYTYHFPEYDLLLTMLHMGEFGGAVIICGAIFAICIVLSIFGRFCKYGKKQRDY